MTREIVIAKDAGEFSTLAAEKIAKAAAEAVAGSGSAAIALAGGTTPAEVYRRLASAPISKTVDFSRVFFFFGDERNVWPDDDSSNFKMAAENLLRPLSIKDANIFRWKTELGSAEAVAADYEAQITNFFAANRPPNFNPAEDGISPRFDLVILGLGEDGHTASLFPHSSALSETKRLAVSNWVEKINDFRFTLTFTAINNAAKIIFLAKGAAKANIVKAVIEGEFRPDDLPAQFVAPVSGNLLWMLDSAAASRLGRP